MNTKTTNQSTKAATALILAMGLSIPFFASADEKKAEAMEGEEAKVECITQADVDVLTEADKAVLTLPVCGEEATTDAPVEEPKAAQ
jgi:hypothetical protein